MRSYTHYIQRTFAALLLLSCTLLTANWNKRLLKAAQDGDLALVQQALKNANINTTNWVGQTPLHLALDNRHKEISEYLIEQKADIYARDETGVMPLHLAALHGFIDIVRTLLSRSKTLSLRTRTVFWGINTQNDAGSTPLHLAAERGHLDIVNILIESGAALEVGDNYKRPPLYHAFWNDHTNVAELLISEGAQLESIPQEWRRLLHNTSALDSTSNKKNTR